MKSLDWTLTQDTMQKQLHQDQIIQGTYLSSNYGEILESSIARDEATGNENLQYTNEADSGSL